MRTLEICWPALPPGVVLNGERGIGPTRSEYLPLALEGPQIEVTRRIREAFDPHRVLNVGKVFP